MRRLAHCCQYRAKVLPHQCFIPILESGAVSVNQVAKIEKSLGRVFCPPHVPSCDAPREIVPPTDTDWVALPERFLDGITFASRFIGNANHIPERGYVERVHCADGKAFATDGQSLVEYGMGASPSFSLQPAKIALLKSFGEAPTQIGVEDVRQWFKWANGNYLTIGGSRSSIDERAVERICTVFDAHDWDNFRKMDSAWRDQIIGHFSYKLARENVGMIHFASDRIVGGRFDSHPDTQLSIETYVEQDVTFEQKQLLRAFKVAEEFRFVHGDGASHFQFKAANVRGMVILNRPLDPIPVLS